MSWERRQAKHYYYQAFKRHGRVYKTYLGTGSVAELMAAEDAKRRTERRILAAAWRQEQEQLGTLNALIDTICQDVMGLMHVVLYPLGYHRHDRGAWRKRHGTP